MTLTIQHFGTTTIHLKAHQKTQNLRRWTRKMESSQQMSLSQRLPLPKFLVGRPTCCLSKFGTSVRPLLNMKFDGHLTTRSWRLSSIPIAFRHYKLNRLKNCKMSVFNLARSMSLDLLSKVFEIRLSRLAARSIQQLASRRLYKNKILISFMVCVVNFVPAVKSN